jgi:hypothetical protein
MAVPMNWQQKLQAEVAEFKKSGPVYGIILPISWRAELGEFVRDRQIQRLIKVQRVGFETDVDMICKMLSPEEQALAPAGPKAEDPAAPKAKKAK